MEIIGGASEVVKDGVVRSMIALLIVEEEEMICKVLLGCATFVTRNL